MYAIRSYYGLRENPLNDGLIAQDVEREVVEETEPAGAKDVLEIGRELTIDGRRFVIDSVNAEWDKVSLRDVTFADAVGFPIFRSESIAYVQYALEHQEPDLPEEQPAEVKLNRITSYNVCYTKLLRNGDDFY